MGQIRMDTWANKIKGIFELKNSKQEVDMTVTTLSVLWKVAHDNVKYNVSVKNIQLRAAAWSPGVPLHSEGKEQLHKVFLLTSCTLNFKLKHVRQHKINCGRQCVSKMHFIQPSATCCHHFCHMQVSEQDFIFTRKEINQISSHVNVLFLNPDKT